MSTIGDALVRLPLAAALGTALALRPKLKGTPPRMPAVVQTQIILAIVGAIIMLESIAFVAIVTAFGAMRLVDRDKGIGFGEGTDVLGALLITSSLMLGVYTIVSPAAEQGWGSGLVLGLSAASLALATPRRPRH